tara:strand:- start:1210 stop:1584 length:375 start_codon:yes stop_codon:yes gene_type:complete
MSGETYIVRECINGTFVNTTLTRTWARTRVSQREPGKTEEYNMRRKAEILKYNENKIKDNSVTKLAKYARIVKGERFRNRIALTNCSKKAPAYHSGVPGNKLLFLNPSTPLYDFGNPNRRYLTD